MEERKNQINEFAELQTKDKELLSKAFQAFNTSILKLRSYQSKLEDEVQELNTELHMKNQELTNILESLSNGLVVTDLKGNILNFNRVATSITGFEREQSLGKPLNELMCKEILPFPLDQKGLEKVTQNIRQEFSLEQNNGRKLIIESSTCIMTSSEGDQLGIIVNFKDVTLIKQLEEEAKRKNRLTAMGEIAANVAHEIRNPLGGIEIFLSMLRMDLSEDPEKIEMINHITSGVRSMNQILSNLLLYTKPQPIQVREVDFHKLVNDFISFSKHLATHQGIEIELNLDAEDALIQGDYELLKQVLHNLFSNANQAMEDGGKLSINTLNVLETSPEKLALFKKITILNKKALSILKIELEDTGKGMTDEVKQRLFDPFFTTKTLGTGLGLSIIRNILDSHKGIISVESTLENGSKIILEFPLP